MVCEAKKLSHMGLTRDDLKMIGAGVNMRRQIIGQHERRRLVPIAKKGLISFGCKDAFDPFLPTDYTTTDSGAVVWRKQRWKLTKGASRPTRQY